jgi:hypothetical protein
MTDPTIPPFWVGQLAQAFGLTTDGSGALAQTLTVPVLNEPAPVPRGRD